MTTDDLSPTNLLIHHSRRDDPSLDDALVLTFNHDLAFFEREALGLLQLTGARITVLGDARVARHDLYAVQRAGTSYLPGLAASRGAFHPKLVALIGPGDATVSIGSGNLTLAGWRGNDELWSVHSAWREGGSVVPSQVGDFLMQLPEFVRLVEPVAASLQRAAAGLQRFVGIEDTGRLVSSLLQPIIDQLPTGPVDELLLYAPFQDEGAKAVGSLLERFEPGHVRIAFQPESTLADGAAIARLIGGRGELVALPDVPYRHGKLIEWASGGRRWALTGSPNLSSAALLRSVREGGNVELGVISLISDSLMPSPREDDMAVAKQPVFRRLDNTPRPSDVIVAAIRVDAGVQVTLARPLSRDGLIEFSHPDDPPERWRRANPAAAGVPELLVPIQLVGGSRLRIAFDESAATPVVFVTDLASVLRTRSARRVGPAPPEIGEVLSDPDTADRFWTIVRSLGQTVKAPRSAPATPRGTVPPTDHDSSVGDWAAYLDRCRGQLGGGLMSFALGLPDVSLKQAGTRRIIDWDSDGDLDDEVGALDDDQPDTDPAEIDRPEPLDLVKVRLTEQARGKYRSFGQRVADAATTTEPHESLVMLRLLLLLAAGDVWNAADLTWVPLVIRGIEALDRCESPELEEAAGSLAATALAVVDHAFLMSNTRVDRSEFRRAAKRVSHLLVAADRARIDEYRNGLARFADAADATDVLRLSELLVNDDPLELSLKTLDDHGVDYELNGRLIVLSKPTPNPLLFARQVRTSIGRLGHVAIRARGKRPGEWALIVSSPPDDVEIVSGTLPRSARVDHRRLLDGRPHDIAHTTAKDPIPADTLQVLARFDLTLADLLAL